MQPVVSRGAVVIKITIPEEHKNIVRQRIKASEADPSRLLNWDEVKDQFKL